MPDKRETTDNAQWGSRRISMWPAFISLTISIAVIVWYLTIGIWMLLAYMLLRSVCNMSDNGWSMLLQLPLSFLFVYVPVFLLFYKVARKYRYL